MKKYPESSDFINLNSLEIKGNLNLKQASIFEFDTIFNVLHENAIWLLSKDIFQWPLDWLESLKPEIKVSITSGLFYIAEVDHKKVAVVEIKTEPEEIWNNDTTRALYIHKLAIIREYENCHLGQEILSLITLKAIHENIKILRLDCVAHNNKLRSYYESCGFELKDVVKKDDISLALYEYNIKP